MSETHLDHPGEVTWFAGEQPIDMGGPCAHDCKHLTTRTLAWGPDYEHYTLMECQSCGCRGWSAEYPAPFTLGPKFREHGWRQPLRDEATR